MTSNGSGWARHARMTRVTSACDIGHNWFSVARPLIECNRNFVLASFGVVRDRPAFGRKTDRKYHLTITKDSCYTARTDAGVWVFFNHFWRGL